MHISLRSSFFFILLLIIVEEFISGGLIDDIFFIEMLQFSIVGWKKLKFVNISILSSVEHFEGLVCIIARILLYNRLASEIQWATPCLWWHDHRVGHFVPKIAGVRLITVQLMRGTRFTIGVYSARHLANENAGWVFKKGHVIQTAVL